MNSNRCLLPDALEDLLPPQAQPLEALRRTLLDCYHSWGYQLVIPPLLSFTESLLLDADTGMDLATFKVVDQLSGRMLGMRADITTQVARIMASHFSPAQPTRLCYVGSVLHTIPKTLTSSRSLIQMGAEYYGDTSVHCDIEIICLMPTTLRTVGIEAITLDLSHVGLYRSLLAATPLSLSVETALFDALQRKATQDIERIVSEHIQDRVLAHRLLALHRLSGDATVLALANKELAEAPPAVHHALQTLEQVASKIRTYMPDIAIYFDLGALHGYRYHTGLAFAALVPGNGQPVAHGGRYDSMGEVFGQAFPATGFSTDLKTLLTAASPEKIKAFSNNKEMHAIFAPAAPENDTTLWNAIQTLRAAGEVVITGAPGQTAAALGCSRQLVTNAQGNWIPRKATKE